MIRSRLPALLIGVFLLAGCVLPTRSVQAPVDCGFPDRAALAYAGESSLEALGLGTNSSGDDEIGRVFVTRDRVPFTGSLPMTPAGPAFVQNQRQYCALYDDSVTLGGVPDDWTAPLP